MTVNSNYTGNTTSVQIVKEATFGTDPGSGYTSLGLYAANVNHELTTNNEVIHALGARAAQAIVGKQVGVTGSISGMFQDARLLAFALGADAVTGVGPYVHWLNYKTAAATPVEVSLLPSFTMVVSRGLDNATYDTIETYTGCRIDNMTIKAGLDSPLEVTVDFIAQNVSTNTSGPQATAFSADEVQPPQNISMKIPNSTAVGHVQNFELSVKNNLTAIHALGTQLLVASPTRQLELGLTATIAFTDEAIWAIKDLTNDSSGASTFAATGAPKVTETCQLVATNSGATTLERTLNVNISAMALNKLSTATRVNDVTMLDIDANILDFTQTNWGATPTGAPIKYTNNTTGAYLA